MAKPGRDAYGDTHNMINIKDHKTLIGMLSVPFHPTLIELILWFCVRFSQTTFTSSYRKDDSGVHGTIPCRGMDIRSKYFRDPQTVVDEINHHWEYDFNRPEKKCAVYHNAGFGPHIHLQVHNNTKRGEISWQKVKESTQTT